MSAVDGLAESFGHFDELATSFSYFEVRGTISIGAPTGKKPKAKAGGAAAGAAGAEKKRKGRAKGKGLSSTLSTPALGLAL